MLQLTPAQTASLQYWFLPERPGPLIGSHLIATGHGACWVDRWPSPRAVLVETAGNYTLSGDADALTPADLQPHVNGFLDAVDAFSPLIHAAFPDVKVWQRVIFAPPANTPDNSPDSTAAVAGVKHPIRRLAAADTPALEHLEPGSAWIGKTWGGAQGLARSGCGWGAFVDGQLAAVACTFFLGTTYEDIGVVTIPEFRRLGLSTACASALCHDIRARGHQPTWATSPDNTASLRIAEKLGFQVHRHDVSYVIGVEIPQP